MPQPVEFTLKPEGGIWTLARDGQHLADFSHLEQATHEAVRHARALEATGAPARVLVHASEGKVIEIDVGPEVTREEERNGPDLDAIDERALPEAVRAEVKPAS